MDRHNQMFLQALTECEADIGAAAVHGAPNRGHNTFQFVRDLMAHYKDIGKDQEEPFFTCKNVEKLAGRGSSKLFDKVLVSCDAKNELQTCLVEAKSLMERANIINESNRSFTDTEDTVYDDILEDRKRAYEILTED